MISPSGGGLGCSAGCWSRHWPFPRAALKLPAPAAGGSQVSGAGAALGRRGRQAALARPCPNPSLPEGARPGSETWAEGFHGLLPEEERAAVSEQQPDLLVTLSCRATAGVDLRLEETWEDLGSACSSRRMAAFCSFSSAGEMPLTHSAQQLWAIHQCGVGSGRLGAPGPPWSPHLPGWALGLPRRAGVPLCTPLPGSAAGRAGSVPGLKHGWGRAGCRGQDPHGRAPQTGSGSP